MKDGILNIIKPPEMTSFDVVAIVRRKLGIRRVGHLGTLDPMAEGVLPVTIGKAGRIMDYLDGDIKEYIAEITFGIRTDTCDIWGKTIDVSQEFLPNREALEGILPNFIGVIDQVPPIYSALKVKGKKLYQYAREGKDVEIEARKAYIPSAKIMSFSQDQEGTKAVLKIACSKGTYIRSIARDLGEELGCGAAMSGLIRTGSGVFTRETGITMNEILESSTEELEARMVDMDVALDKFGIVHLGAWESKLFLNGVPLRNNQWKMISKPDFAGFPLELPEDFHKSYRVYGFLKEGGEIQFLGMGIELEECFFKSKKVLIDR